ncbi:hypothetical protein [Pyxidicoccus caerfyrddinensis]|uniref:hypothetical protein n=1 Tax=Pyxidicoccus caerfyrddinensis TaxID=2709663 RepID=UPI0013D8FC6A|nr:hypothetical protein [Pyxidicoccus caerfyrddinensis]
MSRPLLAGVVALWAFAAGAQPQPSRSDTVTSPHSLPAKPVEIGPLNRRGPDIRRVDDRARCIAIAQRQTKRPQAGRRSPAQVELAFQTALASCAGPDVPPERAAVVGAANVEFRELALKFLDGELSGPAYLAAVGDRNRKVDRARTDVAWRSALASGDADRDFVPDTLDTCPGTPAHQVTDDAGCPRRVALPRQDPAISYRRMMEQQHLMISPACTGAPTPASPAPRRYSRAPSDPGANNEGYKVAVTRVGNQPANCPVFYELAFRMSGPIRQDLPRDRLITVTYRDTEAHAATHPGEVLFRIPASSEGERRELFEQLGLYQRTQIQARAVNGDGQPSAWSEVREVKVSSSTIQ